MKRPIDPEPAGLSAAGSMGVPMPSKDRRLPTDDTTPLRHSPFGALAGAVAVPPQAPVTPPAPGPAPARAVVRLERKGHGGKEVTVVSHLELTAAQLSEWLTALKGSLGCGGQVEGDTIVLQGDQRDRVARVLEARGVRKVTLG